MRALSDTCIVIDLLQKREPFFDDAHKVFLSLANRQYEGYISAKSVADIHYLNASFFGAVRTLLRQIKGGRNDVSSAAQDMNLTTEEFRRLVHDLYPDEVLPE